MATCSKKYASLSSTLVGTGSDFICRTAFLSASAVASLDLDASADACFATFLCSLTGAVDGRCMDG